MKKSHLLPLLFLVLTAGGCRQQSSSESKSQQALPTRKTEHTTHQIQPVEEPKPEAVVNRNPKPVFHPDEFEIKQQLPATLKDFNIGNWPQVIKGTWIEPNRLGNYPSNFFHAAEYTFDETYFYGTEGFRTTLRRIHQQTHEETIFDIPVSYAISSLNHWKGKLYFISSPGITSFDPETEIMETILPPNEIYRQIAILDDCLFYLTGSGQINVYHLEHRYECSLIETGVQWFSLTEDLLIYGHDSGEAYIVDLLNGIQYSTGVIFNNRTYHYDRILFATGNMVSFKESSPYPNKGNFFTIQFGADSLVVVRHYEDHLTYFKGFLVGITEGVSGKAAGYRPTTETDSVAWWEMFEPFTLFSADAFVDLLATTHEKIVIHYYDIIEGSFYYDIRTGETERIYNSRDFSAQDPRAKPPNFEIIGDTILHARTEEGMLTLSIHPIDSQESKLKISGANLDTTHTVSGSIGNIALAGFYDNFAILRVPGGEQGYISHPYNHIFICLKTGKGTYIPTRPVVWLTPLRDGLFFSTTFEERIVRIMDAPW